MNENVNSEWERIYIFLTLIIHGKIVHFYAIKMCIFAIDWLLRTAPVQHGRRPLRNLREISKRRCMGVIKTIRLLAILWPTNSTSYKKMIARTIFKY
jgi:hypothetical protein